MCEVAVGISASLVPFILICWGYFSSRQALTNKDILSTDEHPVLLRESIAYQRYFTIYDRSYSVAGPSGRREISFDVVGHPSLENFTFVVVCPVQVSQEGEGKQRRFTFVEEFAAGSGGRHYALPTGGVERGETPEEAARRELLEEAGLNATVLVPLLPSGHPGILEIKWSRNRFLPYLALQPLLTPGPRREAAEPEETGMLGFSVDEAGAMDLLRSGNLFLPSAVTFQLALDWLQQHPD